MKIFLLFSIIVSVGALFEDQVGKFDWTAKHVGCPNQVQLGRSAAGKDFLLVSSKRNALASINVNSGDIDWRQVQEIDAPIPLTFSVYNPNEKEIPYVSTVVNGGEYLRVFKRANGLLLLSERINFAGRKFINVVNGKSMVIVITDQSLVGFDLETGEKRISTPLGDIDYGNGFIDENGKIIVVTVTGKSVKVLAVDQGTGNFNEIRSGSLGGSTKKCILSGSVLACQETSGSISAVDVNSNVLSPVGVPELKEGGLHEVSVRGYFVVSTSSNLITYKMEQGKLKEVFKTNPSSVFDVSSDVDNSVPLLSVYYDLQRKFEVTDLATGKSRISTTITPLQQAAVEKISVLATKRSLQLLTVRTDCRMDLYEFNLVDSEPKAALEWTRLEALADIASVEMIDLPLSESQAMIETEFGVRDANILKIFFRRIITQIEEVRRSFLSFVDRVIKSYDLFVSKQVSFSLILKNLLGDDAGIRRMKRPRPGSLLLDQSELILERDYFNLRKIVVVASYSGSVYGINSEDGSVLWSLYLGDDMVPLKNQFGKRKIPLFIQRGTAYYQFQSQAIVVFGLKHSSSTRLVVFNPVTGEQTDTLSRPKLKKIEVLPFSDENMIHPLMTIDINENIQFYPILAENYPHSSNIYLFNVDVEGGKMSGSKLDLKEKKITPIWKSSLTFGTKEKFLTIAEKPVNQKIHSPGRVLGDRSVLYKYSNPNLAAIESFDEESHTLSIYLIDVVTGQVIHTARHPKANGPFHIVHCENWVVYTYWNERSRRTEMGVIEIFEGKEQTNSNHFNSFTTTKSEIEVISKSFVFSQGITAMSTSETEMGLTFRSLLIAMPFGGILELPRRIADSRRPLEMTPELREEMIIPYMPEIPIATEELINYNQTVLHIHGIKTAASGLESTSLMLAYGMDMFFSRVTPSGTFDILKDDFDYVLISAVMAFLVISSFVAKRFWRQSSVKQAWA
ncbi:hypothetical protein FO519_005200 [Halicephalobus sp. NKZ332]|nr:hypothetical protein FO519_005200 [Halicephalobus sp. NKZ332]